MRKCHLTVVEKTDNDCLKVFDEDKNGKNTNEMHVPRARTNQVTFKQNTICAVVFFQDRLSFGKQNEKGSLTLHTARKYKCSKKKKKLKITRLLT